MMLTPTIILIVKTILLAHKTGLNIHGNIYLKINLVLRVNNLDEQLKEVENMGLTVASQVKEVIKKSEMNCAGDFCDALDKKIEALVNDAVNRAKSNDRKTVRPGDL